LKHLKNLVGQKDNYRGFNVIAGNLETNEFYYIGNFYKHDQPFKIEKSFVALENGTLGYSPYRLRFG